MNGVDQHVLWVQNAEADTFRLIRRAGFEGVILRWSDSFDDVVCELQPDQARKAGLAVENIYARFRDDNGLWRDNLDGEALTRRLFEFIDDCHRYEIPTMVVHINDGETPPPFNELGLSRVLRIAEKAEQLRRNVAFENTRTAECLAIFLNRYIPGESGFVTIAVISIAVRRMWICLVNTAPV